MTLFFHCYVSFVLGASFCVLLFRLLGIIEFRIVRARDAKPCVAGVPPASPERRPHRPGPEMPADGAEAEGLIFFRAENPDDDGILGWLETDDGIYIGLVNLNRRVVFANGREQIPPGEDDDDDDDD